MALTHALAYIRHPEHDLAACVDPDEKTRAAFMKKWNVANGYATLDAALEAGHYDIASVCSPTGTHLAALTRLLESRVKAIFAEKPLDGDDRAAKKIGAKFDQKGVPVAVNFTRRFDASMHKLKSEIAADRYGKLQSVTGGCGRDIMNTASHLIDLAIFLTGNVPELVRVDVGKSGVSALLDLKGVSFSLLAVAPPDFARFEIELVFTGAIVTIEDSGLSLRSRPIVASEDFAGVAVPGRGEWTQTGYGSAMLNALDELTAWKPGTRLSSDIESASAAIALARKIEHSAGLRVP